MYDDELAAQQSAYSVAGVDETAPIERPQKRKKKQQDYTSDKRAKLGNGDDKPKRERITTSVYVSNLPLDVAAAEVQEYFAKCGVIAEDAGGQKRVKLYYDENGKFKGDALVTYFKPESVPLALQLLDETEILRADGRPSPLVRVQVVWTRRVETIAYGRRSSRVRKLARHKRNRKSRRRSPPRKYVNCNRENKNWQGTLKLKMCLTGSKLADWDDEDYPSQQARGRWSKVVILRYMFTLQELEEDPAAMIELKQDVREECEKIGEVTNVVLFDAEKDGIMSVRFADEDDALECVKVDTPYLLSAD